MKKIKLYIASSIDGYIAEPDGGLDWLLAYPITAELNYGYDEFFNSVDTVIMGGKTYRDILNMDVVYPYKEKTSYIITRNKIVEKDNIYAITENVIDKISALRENCKKDIWLVGGGELINMLLNHDLIDEMIITQLPVIIGNGIPLFPGISKQSEWKTVHCEKYENGVIQTIYIR